MLDGFRTKRTVSPPAVYLVPRQSPDWTAITTIDDLEPESFDHLIGRAQGTTRRLIGLWNQSTGLAFWQVRAAVKQIAGAQLRSIDGLEILDEDRIDAVQSDETGASSWLIPIDDDDLLDPAVPGELAAMDPSAPRGVIWMNWKLAGGFEARANSLEYCFTNNYAISSGYLAAGGDWASVSQHFHATRAFFTETPFGLQVIKRPDLRSIANKHPCCFTALERLANQHPDDFAAALHSAIGRYCALLHRLGLGDGLGPELQWARPSLSALADVFERCLKP